MFYDIMNNNITFTSYIRPVTVERFYEKAISMPQKNYVGYPWTVKESVKAASAYTEDVEDCTAFGITDGAKVFLLHICPTKSQNSNFENIANFIKSKVNLNNNELQGILVGSKSDCRYSKSSAQLFDKFLGFVEKYNIPTSIFRSSFDDDRCHLAYSSVKDEWIISSKIIDNLIKKFPPGEVFTRYFKEVKISPEDIVLP